MHDHVEYIDETDKKVVVRPKRSIGNALRIILILALVVGLVVVALDNRGKARVGYAIGDAWAPTWIILVASAVTGVVIGWLVRHRPGRS